ATRRWFSTAKRSQPLAGGQRAKLAPPPAGGRPQIGPALGAFAAPGTREPLPPRQGATEAGIVAGTGGGAAEAAYPRLERASRRCRGRGGDATVRRASHAS